MINLMTLGKNNKDVFFKETIKKDGIISTNNPFKNDKEFLVSLIAYYESTGEYDKCIPLLDKVLPVL